MQRLFFVNTLGFVLCAVLGASTAEATSDRVQQLLQKREDRLYERLLAWQNWCNDSANVNVEHSLLRRSFERRCERVRDRLTSLTQQPSITNNQQSKNEQSQPQPQPQPTLQPNQTYTPTYPLPVINATSKFLVLGEKAGFVGSVQVNPQDEPVHLREVKITLTSEVSSVSSFEVTDDRGYVLGNAKLDIAESASRDVFTLDLSPSKAYYIEKDDDIVIAVRPILKTKDNGGSSGEELQVSSITFTAIGVWTSRENTVTTSGTDFQKHDTAVALLESVESKGPEIGSFFVGTEQKIAEFWFEGRKTKNGDPAITALTFSFSTPSEVTLSNALIRGNDANDTSSCTVASTEITCSSIPAIIGNIQIPRTISLFADISQTSHPDPFLQVELNQPGTPDVSGDITWTDGDTTFTWAPLDNPIAKGASWK